MCSGHSIILLLNQRLHYHASEPRVFQMQLSCNVLTCQWRLLKASNAS